MDVTTPDDSKLACANCGSNELVPVTTPINKDNASSKSYDYYNYFGLHEEALSDEVRTNWFKESILSNKHLFKDKIVMDIGCGTGLLSMLAVKAGAKHVIGIDCSSIVEITKEIIEDNHMTNKITVIKGRVEQVELPEEYSKVDIIICEWMNYCLFYELLLTAVIYARDKWLVEDGLIFPDKASLYITAAVDFEFRAQNVEWWENVYGFNMSSIQSLLLAEPLFYTVDSRQIVTDYCKIKEIDVYTLKLEDLSFSSNFCLWALRNDSVHSFIVFFTVEFTKSNTPNILSTTPGDPETHWKQSIFHIDPISVQMDEVFRGCFCLSPNKINPRQFSFKLQFVHQSFKESIEKTYFYKLQTLI